MLTLLLALQVSLFGSIRHMGDELPEVRAARHILIVHEEVEGLATPSKRSRGEALALAAELRERLLAGEDFAELAHTRSEAPSGTRGGELGTYPRGVLEATLDEWLFRAAPGEISEPLDSPPGIQLVQRVDSRAGALQILVGEKGDAGRARALALRQELAAGADFGKLASERSDDPGSRARAGRLAVFERGANDSLIKRALFDASVGETFGPLESPLGWHIVRRVEPETIERELWESHFVRLRALVIAHDQTSGIPPVGGRTADAARTLTQEIRAQVASGQLDFAEACKSWNDDPGGRERAGDIGWLHQSTGGIPIWLMRAWREPPGWLSDVITTPAGYVIVRRER